MSKRLFPRLQADELESDDVVLDSYASIRRKTEETIYFEDSTATTNRIDKSPKGNVDKPIKHVVDLINTHPMFSTLSSCSGRIVLFENSATLQDSLDQSSGKGSGGWLLVSHEQVSPEELSDLFFAGKDDSENEANSSISFRMEPLLLHVAAANLQRGRQLLRIALATGFRESGLIVTGERVTVAIRSYSLALSVPLTRSGGLQPSPGYMQACCQEANRRLCMNRKNVDLLFCALVNGLFLRAKGTHVAETVTTLPSLKLWNHAAVAVSLPDADHVVVFGGYGEGPDLRNENGDGPRKIGARRSNSVYALRRCHRSSNSCWSEHWSKLPELQNASPQSAIILGVSCQATAFTEREGCVACLLPGTNIVALFGGRQGPASPLGDLYLYDHERFPGVVWVPTVLSSPPEARWGHSFVALPESRPAPTSNRRLAVMYGGRNESRCFNSIYTLSLRNTEGDVQMGLVWEKLDYEELPCRFHHSASFIAERKLLVLGGLDNSENLLLPSTKSTCRPFTFELLKGRIAFLESDSMAGGSVGHSCISLESEGSFSQCELLLSGGISRNLELMRLLTTVDERLEAQSIPVQALGTLTHHVACRLTRTSEVIMVGGGAAGFGFGPCYAESVCLRLKWIGAGSPVDTPPSHPRPLFCPVKSTSSVATKNVPSGELAPVLYIRKCHGKAVKTALESSNLLHPRCRMLPVEDGLIAVPLIKEGVDVDATIETFVERRGHHFLPLRTGMYARHSRKERNVGSY